MRIEGADRVGQERLLRYCARPPFALTHLHQRDAGHPVYRNPKPARTTAPGARPAALVLTPLELITKIVALVPHPRAHRHRYYGVLAPNASLQSVVTALAPAAVPLAPPTRGQTEKLAPHKIPGRTDIGRTRVIEILECLDQFGVTQRTGDRRALRKSFEPIRVPVIKRSADKRVR